MTTPNTFGKIFINLTWIILLIGLTMYFQGFLDEKVNPNQDPHSSIQGGITEVVLKRNHQHHYVANGFINDTPVTFLVDTGATDVAMGARLAEKIGLERGIEGRARTANGLTTTYATVIDSLRVGEIEFSDVRASITMGMSGNEVLLGMSALKHVELIHRNGELTVRQVP